MDLIRIENTAGLYTAARSSRTICFVANYSATRLKSWNSRLGNASLEKLNESSKCIKDLEIKSNSEKFNSRVACVEGKSSQKYRKLKCDGLIKKPSFDGVFTDMIGPFNKSSLGGPKYFGILMDDHSGYSMLKSKEREYICSKGKSRPNGELV